MFEWLESQLGPVAPMLELDESQEGVLAAIEMAEHGVRPYLGSGCN